MKRVNTIVTMTFFSPGQTGGRRGPPYGLRRGDVHKYINKLVLEVFGDSNRQPQWAALRFEIRDGGHSGPPFYRGRMWLD
jgi:hypothetical protein